MYLLDTNVVSELRKTRPHGAVLAWFETLAERDIHISAVTAGEIQRGIAKTSITSREKAAEIEAWLVELLESLQVLPMDASAFREWARLMHGKSEQLTIDGMVAATARIHGFTVATRNVKDFKPFGVSVFNPFSS